MTPGRLTVVPDEPFVVFLIGMRINRWWAFPLWWPVVLAMPRMLRELEADPEAGLLGYESWFGRTTVMVQYWRSFEHLHRYAHDRERAHVPAWRAFVRRVTDGAVGVWHETYIVEPGSFECVYVNMPAFGLGATTERVPASGPLATARKRLGGGVSSAREAP